MKLSIRQDVLMTALEKGAAAALTEVAQTETSNVALLIKSVKITVGKNLVVESATNLMATQYSIPANKDEGIAVGDPGSVLVPAKELFDWVKLTSPNATINMSLSALSSPQLINALEDSDDDEFVIKKIGSLKIISKDANKTAGKWELNCYDPTEVKAVDFKDDGTKCFSISSSQLKEAVRYVSFAALQKDQDQVLNSLSIQNYEDSIYFTATDTNRCAIYNLKMATDIEGKDPFLVPFELVDEMLKILDTEGDTTLSYKQDIEKLFISQSNLKMRLATVDSEKLGKFPVVSKLFGMPYLSIANIPVNSLQEILMKASLVNGASALFDFKEENSLSIHSISETNKQKPQVNRASTEESTKELRAIWGVKHMLQALKIVKSGTITFSLPASKKNVKITTDQDENFAYFAQFINNPKYQAAAE
jgi:DNA polymerase III sliding clamp (beta) subunit (PCNA family)